MFELDTHVERTALSVKLIMEEELGSSALLPSVWAPLTTAAGLRPLMLSSLSRGIRFYEKMYEPTADGSAAGKRGELKLTVLVVWGDRVGPTLTALLPPGAAYSQLLPPYLVVSHVTPLKHRAAPPICVELHGSPRHNAAAKDSEWVRTRTALEAGKAADVEEILLADAEGRVLEGTQTNFFAVEDGAVHTAGDGVLFGTVRHLVLQVCAAQGVRVILSPPLASRVARWEGAFLTSTSRLVLPINEVRVGGGGGAPWVAHAMPVCPLVERLEAAVEAAVALHSTAIV